MKRLRRSCLATIAVLVFPIAARAQNEPTVPRAAPVTGAPAVPADVPAHTGDNASFHISLFAPGASFQS